MNPIIAIEGHDYSGKTSVASKIVSILNTNGVKAIYAKSPDYQSSTGKVITKTLQGKVKFEDPLDLAQLFSDNRSEALLKVIKENPDHVIILDRSYLSSICTLFHKDNFNYNESSYVSSLMDFARSVKKYEFDDSGLINLMPAVTYILTAGDDELKRRISDRNGDSVMANGGQDIFEGIDRIKNTRNNYVSFSNYFYDLDIVITDHRSINDVALDLATRIGEVLK